MSGCTMGVVGGGGGPGAGLLIHLQIQTLIHALSALSALLGAPSPPPLHPYTLDIAVESPPDNRT